MKHKIIDSISNDNEIERERERKREREVSPCYVLPRASQLALSYTLDDARTITHDTRTIMPEPAQYL